MVGTIADWGETYKGQVRLAQQVKRGRTEALTVSSTFLKKTTEANPLRLQWSRKSSRGKVTSRDIRDLKGTVEREKAAIGVFITLENPTQAMVKEALAATYYESPGRAGQRYRKIQIITIGDLLEGEGVDMPGHYGQFKQAQRHKSGDVNSDGESQKDMFSSDS